MADKPKSGGPAAPSYYSSVAGMEGKPPAGPAGGAATAGGQAGEKVKNVEVLLEVFAKMDKLEQDPSAKAMIQSMSDTAKKYLDQLQGADKKGPAAAPA